MPGKFVRRCGSELAEGAEAAPTGCEIGPGLLALLALLGLTGVKRRWRTTWGAVGVSAARV